MTNAVGLLKEELARIDSIVVGSARAAAVPAGGALAVDRERFAATVEARLGDEPKISVRREEVRALPQRRPLVVACGPLPTEELLAEIDAALVAAAPADGSRRLHYYDAASPIVAADSIDETTTYRKSRYDKGDGDDYLNIPLDRTQYLAARRRSAHVPTPSTQRL